MSDLSISRAWDEAKARMAADGKLMVAVALALIMLPQAVLALVSPPVALAGVEPAASFNLILLAVTVIALVGQLAIARLGLGPATSVGDAISLGVRRVLPLLGAGLILMLGVFVVALVLVMLFGGAAGFEALAAGSATSGLELAAFLLLVLVILVFARFVVTVPVAAAEPGGPIHILKRSWQLTSGHYLKLIGFVLLLLFVALVVSLAVQVGIGSMIQLFFDIKAFSVGALLYGLLMGAAQAIIAVVATMLVVAIYRQLAGPGHAEVSVPSSGT